MTDDSNMSMRKFLKQVGVTSQQAIEDALRAARDDASGRDIPVRMELSSPEIGLSHVIEGTIKGPAK